MRVIGIVFGVIEHLDPTILIDHLDLHVRCLNRQCSDPDQSTQDDNLNNMVAPFGIEITCN